MNFLRKICRNTNYLCLIKSNFCSGFANLLNYKKEGEVCKKHPCDPPKSRITEGGRHRGGFLEAGLKLLHQVSSLYVQRLSQRWIPGSGFETVLEYNPQARCTRHRGGFLEAGLKRNIFIMVVIAPGSQRWIPGSGFETAIGTFPRTMLSESQRWLPGSRRLVVNVNQK